MINGALVSRASRREISVLPTPVGPIIRMFLGAISSRSGDSTCIRRQRLRSARATARLAARCPTMWRSNSRTMRLGVRSSAASGCSAAAALVAFALTHCNLCRPLKTLNKKNRAPPETKFFPTLSLLSFAPQIILPTSPLPKQSFFNGTEIAKDFLSWINFSAQGEKKLNFAAAVN